VLVGQKIQIKIKIIKILTDAPQSSPRTPEKLFFCFNACP